MKQMVTARRQRYWDLRAAGNFIGGGTGTGLIVAAALVAACGGAWQLPAILGPVCMALGLSAVWLEIGRPWRALHVFFHPQTSWMTREGILAGPVMAAAAAALVLGQPLLLALAVALAAGFLYCQARMLRASRGIPAWRQAEVVGLIAATAWAEGAGAALLLVAPSAPLLVLALAGGMAREAAWILYRLGLTRSGAPRGTWEAFAAPPAQLAAAARLAALVLLALAALGVFAPATAAAGGLLAMLSGWALKAILITRAAFTRGAAIPCTPVRGRGPSRQVVMGTAS